MFFKKVARTSSRARLLQSTCVLVGPADREAAAKNYMELYLSPRGVLLKFQAAEGGVCPEWSETS